MDKTSVTATPCMRVMAGIVRRGDRDLIAIEINGQVQDLSAEYVDILVQQLEHLLSLFDDGLIADPEEPLPGKAPVLYPDAMH